MADGKARETLRAVFGFDAWREGQEAVVERLLAGRSTLAVFPTGAGKSLCYQLPALLLEGVTLVVSPLIALMKDQLDFLRGRGVAAARLDSSLDLAEYRQVHDDLRGGRLKLLFVAPERLANERFVQTLRGLRLALLAVDEAHCISEWGHNFRPDYLRLAGLAKSLGVERVLALTATATPEVADQIAAAFGIAAGDRIQTEYHRANLHLRVVPCTAERRPAALLELLRSRPPGPAIVYVTLQKTAEEIAAYLAARGFAAEAYHAGLDAEIRTAVQERFMAAADRVVVATIAFGMGIDKRDLRSVLHFNMPKSLENYAQEIGRAGRDGLPAQCDLLAAAADRTVLENFTFGDTPAPAAVEAFVRDVLGRGETFDLSAYECSFEHDLRPLVVDTVLTYLQLDGLIVGAGPFYAELKFQPLVPGKEMIARFDAARQDFLKRVFRQATQGKTWWTLDLAAAAEALNEPRARISAAFNHLEELGLMKTSASGLRQAFRRTDAGTDDLAPALAAIQRRFAEREDRDIARVEQMFELAALDGCRTNFLLRHFGEDRAAPCGHCDHCAGNAAAPLPPAPPANWGAAEAELLADLRAESHPALREPRALAKFLCGLNSPRASRARLGRHSLFGVWSNRPFRAALAFAERPVP